MPQPYKIQVPGDGPVPAQVAVIMESPGATSVRLKTPHVDPAGQIFWQLAARYAGLDKGQCYIDYLCQRRLDETAKVKMEPAELAHWRKSLDTRLDVVQPRLVVGVGAQVSTALVPGGPLHVSHGIPYLRDAYTVIPTYSPGLAFKQSSTKDAEKVDPLALLAHDLIAVGKFWRGEKVSEGDPYGSTTREVQFQPFDFGPGQPLAIDTEYIDGEPLCLTASYKPGTAFIIWAHEREKLALFADYLSKVRPTIVFHHAAADLLPLRKLGIDILGMALQWRDTIEQAYLLRTEPHALKDLARRHLALEVEDWSELVGRYYNPAIMGAASELVSAGTVVSPVVTHSPKTGKPYKRPRGGKVTRDKQTKAIAAALRKADIPKLTSLLEWAEPSLAFVPEDEIRTYALKDPDATVRVFQRFDAQGVLADGSGLREVEALDNAVVPMFTRMSEVGLLFDEEAYGRLDPETGKYSGLRGHVEADLEALLTKCRTLAADDEFNPASSDDVAEWCRQEYKRSGTCRLYRRTVSGDQEAADKRALSQILGQHPLIEAILAYRSLAKLKSSYIDKLPTMLKAGRYHPNWRRYTIHTGRVGEWILTFPGRTELGRKIRSCFIAPPGCELASFDLSQIELRVCAALSQDPLMLKAFAGGGDLHQMTVDGVFGGDKSARPAAKVVNFRMLYQGGATALYEGLIQERVVDAAGRPRFTKPQCSEIITGWFDTYAGVKELMNATTRYIRTTGYSRTELGRRRYLPAIYLEGDDLSGLQAEAVRQGFNHVIQGTAQEVIKRAMVRVWERALPALSRQGIHVDPLLQYHDELVFQIPEGTWPQVQEAISPCMTEDTSRYNLPILTEGTRGKSWGALKG